MKTYRTFISMAALSLLGQGLALADDLIVIETDNNALVYNVADNNRLYQRYLGKKLSDRADYGNIPDGPEAVITHGMEDYYEPALHINHPDGNPSTLLQYTGHETTTLADGATQTVISLADPVYKDEVRLHIHGIS
mgnify:FL=1